MVDPGGLDSCGGLDHAGYYHCQAGSGLRIGICAAKAGRAEAPGAETTTVIGAGCAIATPINPMTPANMRTGTVGMDVMRTATIPVIEMAPRYGHMPTYTGIQYNTGVAMNDGGREPCGDLGGEPPITHESPSDQPNRQGNGDRRQHNGHPVDCLDGGKSLVAGE